MFGTISKYNGHVGTIHTADGSEYRFDRTSFDQLMRTPTTGDYVSFDISGNSAIAMTHAKRPNA